ncbi:MAG TPA: hypothetical protein VJ202_06005 [Thermodesulfobacteriota bacterium]|nr:hypothetical protein [Thermodesulfobacteriota bacterium]
MTVVDIVAKEFHVSPKEILKDSLKTYLHQRLSKVEANIFIIAKKYGVKDVFELDSRVKKGLINEQDAYDDYFALDNLESEKEKIKKLMEKV